MSNVYIGADHRGHKLKDELKEFLRSQNYTVIDCGNSKYDKDDDYTDFAIITAEKTVSNKAKGIVICGSGAGACIAANKVRGARAGQCINEKQAKLARDDDNANIVCLGADLTSENEAIKIVKVFLESVFSSEERHLRRLNKIKEYEIKNN